MATGLIALLDDVAALTKVAAASLDDVIGQSARAGTKAVGVVIDDAAVTPRYVVGFAAHRELPIVGRIALGSLKNKLLILLPGALALSAFAPWAINPLLMAGGAFLCYEGAEKLVHAVLPAHAGDHDANAVGPAVPVDAAALEEERVSGAVRTDFILSAEIMALTLAGVQESGVAGQAAVLAIVGVGITVFVYGGVALIVKADDFGVSLAANPRPVSGLLGLRGLPLAGEPNGADRAVSLVTQPLGRGLVLGMPYFMGLLSIVGTAAMLWVGGGILLHGLEGYGIAGPAHIAHDLAAGAGAAVPVTLGGPVNWLVGAGISGLVGLVVGAVLIPVVKAVSPVAARLRILFSRRRGSAI